MRYRWSSYSGKLIPFLSGVIVCMVFIYTLDSIDDSDFFIESGAFAGSGKSLKKSSQQKIYEELHGNMEKLKVPQGEKLAEEFHGKWNENGSSAFKDNNIDGGFSTKSFYHGDGVSNDVSLGDRTVWVVTPTYYRPEQLAELTRMAQTLVLVSDRVHWIIIQDSRKGNKNTYINVKTYLSQFSPPLRITFLKSILANPAKDKISGNARGVGGRRAAIQWLRDNKAKGVVYFADDDNTYNYQIFIQMMDTEKVSMWPVGLVTDLGVSSPIVHNGKVIGFYDGWSGKRKFRVDMASFAINLQLFHEYPEANMPWIEGYEEDEILRTLKIDMDDIKPLANNCTEILVWHTKTLKRGWPKKAKRLKSDTISSTNLKRLLDNLPHEVSHQEPAKKQLTWWQWLLGT